MPPVRVDSTPELLARYKAVVFDCDGVLWIQDRPMPGAADAITALRARGVGTYFNTNLSAKTRAQFAEKFVKLGLPPAAPEMLQTSASACADYLVREGFRGKKVYVIGEPGLAAELEAAGVRCCGTTSGGNHDGLDKRKQDFTHKEMQSEPLDPEISAVVVGMDWRLNYYKIGYASLLLQRGARFIASNADRAAPMPGGKRLPAAGCIIAAIETVSGRRPEVITGKPNPYVMHSLLSARGLERSKVLMVGDRLDTDVAFGRAAGVDTLLVLSGTTTEAEAFEAPLATSPTWIAEDVGVLARAARPVAARM